MRFFLRSPKRQADEASVDFIEDFAQALAAVGAFLVAAQRSRRRNPIAVRGGRARARGARRDARGRFL